MPSYLCDTLKNILYFLPLLKIIPLTIPFFHLFNLLFGKLLKVHKEYLKYASVDISLITVTVFPQETDEGNVKLNVVHFMAK